MPWDKKEPLSLLKSTISPVVGVITTHLTLYFSHFKTKNAVRLWADSISSGGEGGTRIFFSVFHHFLLDYTLMQLLNAIFSIASSNETRLKELYSSPLLHPIY